MCLRFEALEIKGLLLPSGVPKAECASAECLKADAYSFLAQLARFFAKDLLPALGIGFNVRVIGFVILCALPEKPKSSLEDPLITAEESGAAKEVATCNV